MLTLTGRLFRFLLSLVIRLRLPIGRIVPALRYWSSSLWRSILTFASHRGQPWIRLHASNVPVVGNTYIGERTHISEYANVEEAQEQNGTLVTRPARTHHWQHELSRYQNQITARRPLESFALLPGPPGGGLQRHKRRTVCPATNLQFDIPAGRDTLLSSIPVLPDGWNRHTHPEGNVFFHHEGLHIYTENNICNREKEEEILLCATKLIEKAIEINGATMDEPVEVVLNVDDSRQWHYYFVDHTNHLLFWVDTVTLKDLNIDLQGANGYGHIRYMIEAYYWYPFTASPVGMMTSYSFSSLFGQDELDAILDLVNSLKEDGKICDPYSVWVIARLMTFLTENQFLNICGRSCARWNADTPLFEHHNWHHLNLFKAINVFLFGSPNEYAIRLQRVWVNGIFIQSRWKSFVSGIMTDLARCATLCTVMLAVNVSFLAIPGIVTPGSPTGPIEIFIYCSVVATVASILFSFGLLNVYSDQRQVSTRTTVEAIRMFSRTKSGMACLAITFSLPVASLIWSIALFFTAFVVLIFGAKERATVATLGVECLVILLFLGMGAKVIRLLTRNDDGSDRDTPVVKMTTPTTAAHDVELGSVA